MLFQGNDSFEDLARFLSGIDDIAQEYDSIVAQGSDGQEHRIERVEAAVDVADGDQATYAHGLRDG
jgi:hypothetical protein